MGFLYNYAMELTSLDYMKLISWLAYYKHGTILNKTQMQKILFMCYGSYYAMKDTPLFKDDTPKAWPYGPVFPRVNVRYNPANPPLNLTDDDKKTFAKDVEALKLVTSTVAQYGRVSAHELSEWSHEKGSPWFKTVYGENGNNTEINWNKEIPSKYIKEYFKSWRKL